MNRNVIIIIVLVVLVLLTAVQAVQLSSLKSQLGSSAGKVSVGGSPSQGASDIPSSISDLPSQVGGC